MPMIAYATRTSPFGLCDRTRQAHTDGITVVEPRALSAPESRKGHLYMITQNEHELGVNQDVCQLAMRVVQKKFYEDSSLSVTSSLRAALHEANRAVYQYNLKAADHRRASVGITCAVMKGRDLFLAQVVPSQAYILTEGHIRPLPPQPSWNPTFDSAAPFLKSRGMGASLFVEPELYRNLLRVHDAFLLCSSNIGQWLSREQVTEILGQEDQAGAVEHLLSLCEQQGMSEAHGLLVKVLPMERAEERKQRLRSGLSEGMRWLPAPLASWAEKVTGQPAGGQDDEHDSDTRDQDLNEETPPDPMTTMPEQPDLPPSPIPLPRPLEMGETIDEHYQRIVQERRPEETAESAPGEDDASREDNLFPTAQSARDVYRAFGDAEEAQPFRPHFEKRPWVDMRWDERLLLPFHYLKTTLGHRSRRARTQRRIGETRQPVEERHSFSYDREKPSFPWLQLVALGLLVALLIVYGMSLSRESAEQEVLEYINQAQRYLVQMNEATTHESAVQHLENASQVLEQVQASPLVTETNPVLWLPFREIQTEYQRGLGLVQGLTFFEEVEVLSEHPAPGGRFASVVVPPPTARVTDTQALEAANYIYALDGDKNNAHLYRIPRRGGAPEPFLSPDDVVENTLVGPIQAQAWRINNIVALDRAPTNFGYYFHTNGQWNYIRLGGSEVWVPPGRIDLETYEGNLYLWGVEPGEIIKFTSGRYGDIPQLWLDAQSLENADLSLAVDMSIDGNIYLLMPDGRVLVFQLGRLEREIAPEGIMPPVTAVSRMALTGSPESGWVFLLDTFNERIIQLEKSSGNVIQQMKVRAESPVQLNQLTDLYVDASTGRPVLYLVNGGQIVRARVPAPPPPFEERLTGEPPPTATP